jgi:hypothetical protein
MARVCEWCEKYLATKFEWVLTGFPSRKPMRCPRSVHVISQDVHLLQLHVASFVPDNWQTVVQPAF